MVFDYYFRLSPLFFTKLTSSDTVKLDEILANTKALFFNNRHKETQFLGFSAFLFFSLNFLYIVFIISNSQQFCFL